MKDRLEEFIAENREAFDFYEPADAVWEKIEKNKKSSRVVRFNYRTVLVRVAAVIVIFFGSYYVHDFMQKRNNNKIALKSRIEENLIIIPELVETEAYYASQVSDRLNELKAYTANYPEIEEDVRYDLNELDSVYAELKRDLKDNVANDEVIEALIQNYRLKLKILEDLLYQLKQTNPDSHRDKNTEQDEIQTHEL